MRMRHVAIVGAVLLAFLSGAPALAQSSTVVKSRSIVRTAAGNGVSRTQTAVTIPTVPSEPTTTPRRSRPWTSAASEPRITA